MRPGSLQVSLARGAIFGSAVYRADKCNILFVVCAVISLRRLIVFKTAAKLEVSVEFISIAKENVTY